MRAQSLHRFRIVQRGIKGEICKITLQHRRHMLHALHRLEVSTQEDTCSGRHTSGISNFIKYEERKKETPFQNEVPKRSRIEQTSSHNLVISVSGAIPQVEQQQTN